MSDGSEQDRLEINWVRSVGSALAAVSAAVLLSTLGAAGTLIGAALGSLVVTIGGAVYSHSFELTRRRVAGARAPGTTPESASGTRTQMAGAGSNARLRQAAESGGPSPGESRAEMLRGLPWKRIIATAGALFIIVMAIILAFELWTGRAVSSITGGTSGTGPGTSIPGIDAPFSDREGTGTEGVPQPEETPAQEQPTQDQVPTQGPAPLEGQTPAPSQEAPADPIPTSDPEQPAEPAPDQTP